MTDFLFLLVVLIAMLCLWVLNKAMKMRLKIRKVLDEENGES